MSLYRTLNALLFLSALGGATLIGWQSLHNGQAPVPPTQLNQTLPALAQAFAASITTARVAQLLPPTAPCTKNRDWARLNSYLDQVDDALTRMAERDNRFLDSHYRIDRERLMAEAQGTGGDCDSLTHLVRELARHRGAALTTALKWRERAPRGRQAEFGATLAKVDTDAFAKANPWRPLPGCILMGKQYWPQPQGAALCAASGAEQAASGDALPPDADELRSALDRWLAVADPGEGNRVRVLGRDMPQGAHVGLTLVPQAQAAAQQVARCHAGGLDACRALGLNPDIWRDRYEGAAARHIGILQLDIASGEIEVLASAASPCYRQDNDGPGHDPNCPNLPAAPAYRPANLANFALHGSAMWGSLVKPLLALGLLRSDLGPHLRTGLGRRKFIADIKTSSSEAFMDRLFGKDKGWRDTGRLSQVGRVADDLGQNGHCAPASRHCGVLEPLLGGTGHWLTPGTRFLRQPVRDKDGALIAWQPMTGSYTPEWAMRCAHLRWHQCTGGQPVDRLAEAWGQGHSQASPLGIAGLWSRLGTAANDGKSAIPPHLVAHVSRQGWPDLRPAPAQLVAIAPDDARLILEGMQQTHTTEGTAHGACVRALGSAKQCNRLDGVAGKTGTPMYDDGKPLADRRQHCIAVSSELAQAPGAKRKAVLQAELAHCAMAPIKWYAALLRTDSRPGAPWDKVIVVIAERNFERESGLVDGAKKARHPGANVAAEIAFHLMRRNFPQALARPGDLS